MRLWTVLLSAAICCSQAKEMNSQRKGKFINLFNVVQFENGPCTGSGNNPLTGTCRTEQECKDSGGTNAGNCAAGFGICCTYTVECGGTVSQNNTYLRNKDYPAASTAATCSYTFNRIGDDICQIRLDFDTLETNIPTANTGACTDQVTVKGGDGVTRPVICGKLTGSHMYFETGPTGSAGTLDITHVVANAATRMHNIRATYYECSSLSKAPPGCVQYFTGTKNTITSYGFGQSQTIVRNNDYGNCVRKEMGFCSLNVAQSAVAAGKDAFRLDAVTNGMAKNAATCTLAYLIIPDTSTTGDKRCGDSLNEVVDATEGGVINGLRGAPFVVQFVSVNAAQMGTGFSVDYTQVPC